MRGTGGRRRPRCGRYDHAALARVAISRGDRPRAVSRKRQTAQALRPCGCPVGTQIFGAGVGIVNGMLLARLFGPAGKGDYYIIARLPATAMALLWLGLPQALGFFSARGQTLAGSP